MEALVERMVKSENVLLENGNLDLRKFKVFYFARGKWQRIEGKRVTKSAFGLWITREKVSKIIKLNESHEILVSPF